MGETAPVVGRNKHLLQRAVVLAWRIPGTGEPGGLPSACLLYCEEFYSKKHKDQKGESTHDGYHQLNYTSRSIIPSCLKGTSGITKTE